MYLLCGIKITVGSLIFNEVSEVEIKRTWRELTKTAKISLPRTLKFPASSTTLSGRRVEDVIKAGDSVKIELAYEPTYQTEFEGYVTRVKPGVPLELECEDEMYKLRKTNYTKSWKTASLKDVVSHIAPGYTINVLNAQLGPFRITKANACQVLDNLKENYGFSSYFRDKVLTVGFAYPDESQTVIYHFQKNVASNSLEYRRKEDVKIKVKAISKSADNKTVEAEVGDDGGDERTMHFYNLDKTELTSRATEELDKIKVDGYSGTLAGFGVPYADHGDIAELRDDEFEERAGKYFIDAVTVKFGSGGYRRELELGKKAS